MIWTALLIVSTCGSVFFIVDPHRHWCSSGHRWWHVGLGHRRNVNAHTCPQCGEQQWDRQTK